MLWLVLTLTAVAIIALSLLLPKLYMKWKHQREKEKNAPHNEDSQIPKCRRGSAVMAASLLGSRQAINIDDFPHLQGPSQFLLVPTLSPAINNIHSSSRRHSYIPPVITWPSENSLYSGIPQITSPTLSADRVLYKPAEELDIVVPFVKTLH